MKNKLEFKNINKIAYPILLNYLLISVFEIMDKAIVGHYSVNEFALVGIAASIIYAVTGALGILSACFNIIAAEKKGKKDEEGFETAFIISKTIAIVIGLIFLILSIFGGSFFFENLYGIKGQELEKMLSYFIPAAVTVLQNMMTFQYSAYFRNSLNTRITLYSTIVSTGINLFFDFSLVYGYFGFPRLGMAGAAWGSVIGLAAGLLVYQVVYFKNNSFAAIKKYIYACCEKLKIAKNIFKLYPSLFGQELLESTIFVLVVSYVVTRLGTEKMAVYNLLDTVASTVGLPVFAYATATQTYALQEHSAREQASVKRYLKTGIEITTVVLLVLSSLCVIFQKQVLSLIVSDTMIIDKAGKILWLVLIIEFVKIPYQIFMSYLQGVEKEKFVFLCTAVSTVIASIGVLVLGNLLSLSGIYLVMILEYFILSGIYIRKSK